MCLGVFHVENITQSKHTRINLLMNINQPKSTIHHHQKPSIFIHRTACDVLANLTFLLIHSLATEQITQRAKSTEAANNEVNLVGFIIGRISVQWNFLADLCTQIACYYAEGIFIFICIHSSLVLRGIMCEFVVLVLWIRRKVQVVLRGIPVWKIMDEARDNDNGIAR